MVANYSSTFFYKIHCKDAVITDLYVGHTTDFVKRRYQHERNCNNPSYDLKVYNIIRANGGWDNWNMELLAFRNCVDLREAKRVEQEFYENLNATLNSVSPSSHHGKDVKPVAKKPMVGVMKYHSELCHFTNHNKTDKHNKSEDEQKVGIKYRCELCHFYTNDKTKYTKHLETKKHKMVVIDEKKSTGANICACGKEYKHRQGLSRHKKTCPFVKSTALEEPEPVAVKPIMTEEEFQTRVVNTLKEILPQIIGNNIDVDNMK